MTPEEKRIIETIVWRTNREVVKVMKKIPSHQLFGWKGEKEINEK